MYLHWLGIFLFSFSLFNLPLFPQKTCKEPLDYLGGTLKKVASEGEKKYGLITVGTSVSSPDGVLQSAGLNFILFKQLSKEELREMLYMLTNSLLNEINNDQTLRLCLEKYPFDSANTSIIIFIMKDPRTKFYYPDLCIASLEYGKYVFQTNDPDIKHQYKTHEEILYIPNEFDQN